MAQGDAIHDAVANALPKDGWTITADPPTVNIEDIPIAVDVLWSNDNGDANSTGDYEEGKILEAIQNERLIAVVITKLFASSTDAFWSSAAYYYSHRRLLEMIGRGHKVYLAVTKDAYWRVFQRPKIRNVVERQKIALLVVRTSTEEVVSWNEPTSSN